MLVRVLLGIVRLFGTLTAILSRPTPPEQLRTTAGSCTRWLHDPNVQVEYVERWRDGELIDVEVHAT